jgi:hypothetical protein
MKNKKKDKKNPKILKIKSPTELVREGSVVLPQFIQS